MFYNTDGTKIRGQDKNQHFFWLPEEPQSSSGCKNHKWRKSEMTFNLGKEKAIICGIKVHRFYFFLLLFPFNLFEWRHHSCRSEEHQCARSTGAASECWSTQGAVIWLQGYTHHFKNSFSWWLSSKMSVAVKLVAE